MSDLEAAETDVTTPIPPAKTPRATIVYAVLMIVFLAVSAGAITLYLQKTHALSTATAGRDATISAQNGRISAQNDQIAQLSKALQAAKTTAAAQKLASEKQIGTLQRQQQLTTACGKDVSALVGAATETTFNKAWTAMIKDCVPAH